MSTQREKLREQLAVARGFAPHAPDEALARARCVEAAARQALMDAPDEDADELESVARYAARRARHYEQLLERRQAQVRARERVYRDRERRELDTALPPKIWNWGDANGDDARRAAATRPAREHAVAAPIAAPHRRFATASG